MTTLSRKGPFPPGGWRFTDQRTGRIFNGLEANFEHQIQHIVQHRRANKKLYPEPEFTDPTHVGNELEKFTRDRLKLSEKPAQKAKVFLVQKPSTVCPKCGSSEAEPILCKTCSGRKVTGWTCLSCGAERKK